MKTVTTAAALNEKLEEVRSEGERIALVPTMGALHEGHLSLVRLARGRARRVVVSLFVNPMQFGAGEDLDRYPRDLEGDSRKLAAEGVDLLFAPGVEEIYPPGFATTVRVAGVSEGMEGARRPGHFDGVATVVTRLVCLVLPDVAVFGAKDGQQVAVVRRLLLDLGLPVELHVGETVREADGLALSSRNALLSPAERAAAPVLYRGLSAARALFSGGERDASALLSAARAVLGSEPALRLAPLPHVDPATKRSVPRVEGPVMLAAAALFGRTRLIDNVVFG